MKNLEFFYYRYGLFLDGNLPLIFGHVLSKFDYFLSRMTPRINSKTEPHCAENYLEFTVPRAVRGPYVS
jgi:hypothetical protein